MKRRKFIEQVGIGAAASLIPSTLVSFTPGISSKKEAKILNIGIVSDVHKDLMPDANQRLKHLLVRPRNET